MCPSYFRIRLSLDEALARFAAWFPGREQAPPRPVALRDAVPLSTDAAGGWNGIPLFIHHRDGWTVFEDLSGPFTRTDPAAWLDFAHRDPFVLAGYNDALPYGELVVIRDGTIARQFFDHPSDPSARVDRGTLPDLLAEPLRSWLDVASFVDDDEIAFSETGLLWIFDPAGGSGEG